MQELLKKDSDMSAAHSAAPSIITCPSWWTNNESHTQQSSLSENLSLKIATPPPHCQNGKQMGFQFQEQESSSTQSTGQSYHEVASVGESNQYGKNILPLQSGYNESHAKTEGHAMSTLSMGTQDYVLPPQADYRHPYTCVPLPYADPFYRGLLAAYGPQTVIYHPQMAGVASARVPLPLDIAQDEPIYVNAKQYRAILRRREFRAKLEAQRKLSKVRKPYLHESRHLHALKRARGSGGRFLNIKKLEGSDATTKEQDVSGSAQLQMTTRMSESDVRQPENYKEETCTNSCSEISSVSNCENIYHNQEFRFSVYPSHAGRPMQGGGGGGVPGQNQQYLSVFR
ncbi:hypothetical protein RJ640_008445 [Escallonia rubra]|uniref:Nuclear transcription factor Y subunit n=1 Tax=Escallonia rubra TaxID=112253 RepID=A0AA88QIG1_9ASTE|nr:hypothetical protein RJ640_008445 [Escallonia rubra]